MIPFWHFGEYRRKPTLQENIRAFKIVGILLLSVTVVYVIIALLVFGHL